MIFLFHVSKKNLPFSATVKVMLFDLNNNYANNILPYQIMMVLFITISDSH